MYARHVDSSSLGFSLSSHRQSYIGLVFSSHFICDINLVPVIVIGTKLDQMCSVLEVVLFIINR